jgi:hypothetical protein
MQAGYTGFLFIAGWAHYFYCSFPRWAQGHWENLHVNGNQLTYRDQKTFHVSSVHCVGNNMGESGDKFGIYSRNQWWAKNSKILSGCRQFVCLFAVLLSSCSDCSGEDRYSCLTMKKRANNVVELKMSESLNTKSVLFRTFISLLSSIFFYFNLDAGQFRFKQDPGWRVGGRRSARRLLCLFLPVEYTEQFKIPPVYS